MIYIIYQIVYNIIYIIYVYYWKGGLEKASPWNLLIYCWWFRNPAKKPPGMLKQNSKYWDKLPTGARFLPSIAESTPKKKNLPIIYAMPSICYPGVWKKLHGFQNGGNQKTRDQTQGHKTIGSPWRHLDDFLSASAGKRWAEQDHTIHLEYACSLLPAKKKVMKYDESNATVYFWKNRTYNKNIHFSGVDMATQVNIWHELWGLNLVLAGPFPETNKSWTMAIWSTFTSPCHKPTTDQ